MSASDLRWQRHAACRGNAPLFFGPEDEKPGDRQRREAQAKAICADCPVWIHCLRYRLGIEQQLDGGIWAGKDEYERRQLRWNMLRAQRRRAA